MKRMILIGLVVTITASGTLLSAQNGSIEPSGATDDQSRITAGDVVKKYIEAIGGIDALKRIRTKRVVYRTHMFPREPYAQERVWTRPYIMQSGPPGEPPTMAVLMVIMISSGICSLIALPSFSTASTASSMPSFHA